MSPGLSAETSTFSDTGKEMKCFVGDLNESDTEGEWMGDEVKVEITGTRDGQVRTTDLTARIAYSPTIRRSQRLWVGYIDEDSRGLNWPWRNY